MRYTDTLKPLTSKIKVYKIASYDIETYGDYNEFLQGGFIDGDGKYKSFTNRKDMITYMLEHTDKDTYIYATNNMFDFQALFSKQKDYHDSNYTKILLRGGRIIVSEYHGMKFLDTLNYVQSDLKTLGKMLKIYKREFDVEKNDKDMNRKDMKKLINYNRTDCIITREFMIQFQKVLNELGGELKVTIGSCAMNLYRRKYLKQNIYKEYQKYFEDGTEIKEFIFKALHGGRTEVFKKGDTKYEHKKLQEQHLKTKKYYYYDFNSMYADVMRNEYPIPSSARINEDDLGNLSSKNTLLYHGVTECEVLCPYMYYPILPHFINKKLCFPIGQFRDIFMNGELQEFVRQGGIILKIYKQIYYTKTFTPFKEWVTDLYGIRNKYRKQGNEIYSTIVKNLLVNLFGKFLTHKLSEFEMFDINDGTKDAYGVLYDEELNISYRETPIDREYSYVIPIFGCTVTMYGRLKLYQKLVELDGIYCDTDSVFTDKYIESGYELGQMKLENAMTEINTVRPKFYRYKLEDGTIIYKAKGLRLGKNKKITKAEEFENAIDGKKIMQMKFLKLKESLRGGGLPNEKIMFTKRMSTVDDKRVWIKPYNKKEFQDSKPLLVGFKSISDLETAYNLIGITDKKLEKMTKSELINLCSTFSNE